MTEENGLDLKKHGEAAYPAVAYGHGWKMVKTEVKKEQPKLRVEELPNIETMLPPLSDSETDDFASQQLHF